MSDQRIDALGFVTIDQIQNVFSESMTLIEEDCLRQGCPTDPRMIIEWIDHVRQDLLRRARTNVADYIRKNPTARVQDRQTKEAEAAANPRKKTWQEKVADTRAQAIRDCY